MFIDFRERKRKEKKHRCGKEKHQLVASGACQRDGTCNFGQYPDQELILQPFFVLDDAPPT